MLFEVCLDVFNLVFNEIENIFIVSFNNTMDNYKFPKDFE